MPKLAYFEIAVASPSAKRQAIFTYSSDQHLALGQLVSVPLKKKRVMGVVLSTVKKPSYTARAIYDIYQAVLPKSMTGVLRWMLDFYPLDQGATVKLFCPSMPPKKKSPASELPATEVLPSISSPHLTTDQMKAIDTIRSSKGPIILFGVTGSGKTRVYEEVASQILSEGRSVLFLAPEISLGQHLLSSFEKHMSHITTYHSLLTPAQRRDIWYGLASSTRSHFIIGPRSSLFLPITNLGAIIIDEAHDQSYKHQQAPYYSTLQVAARLARERSIPLVYGSATPNVSDYYSATQKDVPIVTMHERPVQQQTNAKKAEFTVFSTRDVELFRRSAFIATPVLKAIGEASARGKQSLLLLNRRGTAQLLRCDTCGWQMECATCEHAVVYHKDIHQGICHICTKKYPVPALCPECNSTIRMFVIGTKYIEEHIQSLFPQTTVLRIDSDAIDRQDIQQTLQTMNDDAISIIVGTQLLAKGLDLPRLENIVVLDASRQSSDYLSDERYYQLLHQVFGRGMRGYQSTQIFIQTLQPDDQILSWATEENWQAFYARELAERQRFGYPPFTYLASAYFEKSTSIVADRVVQQYAGKLTDNALKVQVLGPIRELRTIGKKPIWRVLLKSSSRHHLVQAGLLAPSDWRIDFEPINV